MQISVCSLSVMQKKLQYVVKDTLWVVYVRFCHVEKRMDVQKLRYKRKNQFRMLRSNFL